MRGEGEENAQNLKERPTVSNRLASCSQRVAQHLSTIFSAGQ